MSDDRDKVCRDTWVGVVDPHVTMLRIKRVAKILEDRDPMRAAELVKGGGEAGLNFWVGDLILFRDIIDELKGEVPRWDGIPDGIWECEHGSYQGYHPITRRKNALNKEDSGDFDHLKVKHGFSGGIVQARLCTICDLNLPSIQDRHRNREMEQKEKDAAARKVQIEILESAKSGKEPLYLCRECDEIWDEGDLVHIRYCPAEDCQSSYDASDSGQTCNSCNRPFTRKVTEKGCPGCASTGGEDAEDCVPMTSDRIDDRLHDLKRGRI